jgi:hypothetical protein
MQADSVLGCIHMQAASVLGCVHVVKPWKLEKMKMQRF